MFREYPYLNLQDLNLDYVLRKIREMQTELNNFVVTNAIKYADPIDWNITTQYEKNTVVIDANSGIAYLSVQPVPSGVGITNTDYWTVIFDLSMFIDKAAKNLTEHVEGQTNTATFNSAVGDWLIWYDVLYIATNNINAGDAYVVGSNIEKITIEDIIKAILTSIAKIGDLDNLTTTDKSTIVNAINEVNSILLSTVSSLEDNIILDKIYKPFVAQRICSAGGTGNVIKYDNNYLSVIDGVSSFTVYLLDDNLNVINSTTINEAIHSNSIFVEDGKLYILDSNNFVFFILDVTTLALIDRNASLTTYYVAGMCAYNNKFYFRGMSGGDRCIIITDNAFNVESVSTLEMPTMHASTVYQDIAVVDDIIYILINCPNALLAYNKNGRLLGIKEIGEGNDYFPYCECELIYIDNDDVYMSTVAYNFKGANLYQRNFVFKTNLLNDVPSDSEYGQTAIQHKSCDVDTGSTTVNPDGFNNPFSTLYEAGVVLDYVSRKYSYLTSINVVGDFSSDAIFMTRDFNLFSISTMINVGYIGAYHNKVNLSNIHALNMDAERANVYLYKSLIDTINMSLAKLDGEISTITAGTLYKCIVGGCFTDTNEAKTITDCTFSKVKHTVGDNLNSGTATVTNADYNKYLLTSALGAKTIMRLYVMGTRGGDIATGEIVLTLDPNNRTTIRGGGTVTQEALCALYVKTLSMHVYYHITITFTESTITITPVDAVQRDGTTTTFSGVYLNDMYMSLE